MQVTVIDTDRTAICKGTADPHFYTFDKVYYNLYLEGEFIMYEHTELPYVVSDWKCLHYALSMLGYCQGA